MSKGDMMDLGSMTIMELEAALTAARSDFLTKNLQREIRSRRGMSTRKNVTLREAREPWKRGES